MTQSIFGPSSLFGRLDLWLLLRYPRIWQTRIHVALLLALLAHPLTFSIGSFLAPLIAQWNVARTNVYTWLWHGDGTPSVSGQEHATYFAWNRVLEQSESMASLIMLSCVSCFMLSMIGALLLGRSQSQYSIEEAHGPRHPLAGWIELACCLLVSAVFAFLPLSFLSGLSPTSRQIEGSQRIEAQSDAIALRLIQQLGKSPSDFQKVNRFGWGTEPGIQYSAVVADSGLVSPYSNSWWGLELLAPESVGNVIEVISRPIAIRLDPSSIPAGVTIPIEFSLRVADGAAPGVQQYFSDLEDFSYVRALRATSTGDAIWVYRHVVGWWLVGILSLIVFLRKRSPASRTFLTFLVGLFAIPAMMFCIFVMLNSFGAIFSRWPQDLWPKLLAIGLFALNVALLFASCVAMLVARRLRHSRPWVMFGVQHFPFALAFLPPLTLLLYFVFSVDFTGPAPSTFLRQFMPYVPPALAMMPFVFVPFLPIWESTLIRHNTLPKAE